MLKPHGVKGELRVRVDIDDAEPYLKLEDITLRLQSLLKTYEVEQARMLDKECMGLKLKGVDDRNAAELLRNAVVLADSSLLPQLEEGKFYYHELIDATVVDEATNREIGTIVRILEMPAQDVLEVAAQGGTVLIPLVDAFLRGYDRESHTLYLHLPPGLVEVYLGEQA